MENEKYKLTVFQTDSDCIKNFFFENRNYKIEESSYQHFNDKICCIYFSSNNIYFPNDEKTFQNRIIEKDYYEWYNTRLKRACKHIFIRDIKKQWYLNGINNEICSPALLFEFLVIQTKGYNVVTIGSSAGGYAAVLYGKLLNAKQIITFNGQFEINSLLLSSAEKVDPLVFRFKDSKLRFYYDLKNVIKSWSNIYYFRSIRSFWDIKQFEHIKDEANLYSIGFKTNHHGIPFLKCNLEIVINFSENELRNLASKIQHPILFSVKLVGIKETIRGFFKQFFQKK